MSTATLSIAPQPSAGKALRIGLWVAQILAAAVFVAAGLTKLTLAPPELTQSIPWSADFSLGFVRAIGIIDLLGGLGLVLPAATHVLPRLTVLAAIGCVVLQLLAMAFHVWRGEFSVLPLNALLLGLSAFVAWGRGKRVPIAARP